MWQSLWGLSLASGPLPLGSQHDIARDGSALAASSLDLAHVLESDSCGQVEGPD